ncbi:MAG: 2,5-diamino-6-(ribosylamino)-4(3H)-pyrimidinone 5'-phosphate reductase [Euryarchaeota archaeon]|nr:2,5-diamino-6-(ribosylamino)-4(3H)-pyrimidinone 5'-phosphate reductase [Euryarchaeota archaeon]
MRPHITINCAMTADGKLAGRSRKQIRISSEEDMDRVKKMRASSDAILVGVGTVIADDPHLTVKGLPPERNPLRVVLDSHGRTPIEAKVLNTRARTLIATTEKCQKLWPGAEIIRCGNEQVDLTVLMDFLGKIGIRTLMVEGGGETIFSFFQAGLVDQYKVFIGSQIVGGRNSPTPADGEGFPDKEAVQLTLIDTEILGEGVLLSYKVHE